MTLEDLFASIEVRATADPETSWTASLLAQGPEKCAEKFGEEAIEAIYRGCERRQNAAHIRGGRCVVPPVGDAEIARRGAW